MGEMMMRRSANIGPVYAELSIAVSKALREAPHFNSSLVPLDIMLMRIQPMIDETDKLKRLLNCPKEEIGMLINLLRDGKVLVGKCSTIKLWNLSHKYTQAKKLIKLYNSLQYYFHNEPHIVTRIRVQIAGLSLDGEGNGQSVPDTDEEMVHTPPATVMETLVGDEKGDGPLGVISVPLQLCRRFTFAEVQSATDNFDEGFVVGKGGFGKVYKGFVDNGATTVAIKRLDPTSKQGGKEFRTEIEMLSKFRHCHLVSLIGYCYNSREMILVYEYMLNGSMADHLHPKDGRNGNSSILSWVQRLKICIGAAHGIDYLHTGTGVLQRVIHRDVKTSNILLDENWAAKVSDFGLCKIGPANQSCTHVSTCVKGTPGYCDPDYFLTHRVTRKSDVYAFGVVLLEVLSGKPAVDLRLPKEQRSLVAWAKQCIQENTPHKLIDPTLKWEICSKSLEVFVKIADRCIQNSPKDRPQMAEVVTLLELALAMQTSKDSSLLDEDIFNFGNHVSTNEVDTHDAGELPKDDQGRQIMKENKSIESLHEEVDHIQEAGIYVDTPDNITKLSCELAETPHVGMIFESVEAINEYYSSYGKEQGFAITKRSSTFGNDGNVIYITFACTRGEMAQNSTGTLANPMLSCKTQCQAKIRASRQQDGSYKFNTVVLYHNHDLSPRKARFFGCNRGTVKRSFEVNDRADTRLHKSFNSFAVEAGGHDNLRFSKKDGQNYIDKARGLRLGPGDAKAVHKYFLRMQERNSGFFYAMDVDDECRIRNMFWADARSRATYEDFGDVVTFDTTYLTNKHDMPLVPFVGVNHHGQSVLFGCGLISSQDTQTFVWLFETWKACMHRVTPKAIITDQCKAMQNAIEKVFPDTRHRWCLWHIMKKVPEKLSGYTKHEAISFDLHNCVYDSQSKDGFEEAWKAMIEKYSLHKNQWLTGLYEERNRWVPIYVKDTFFAGMSTTQRSESINVFFDGCVHSKTTLKQFVEQYDHALCKKIEEEKRASHQSFNSTFECITRYPLEKQFQEAYTNLKFKEFQEEIKGMIHCLPNIVNEVGGVSTYKVRELVFEGSNLKDAQNNFDVQFNGDVCVVNCACNLFQFSGILCRHALAVLTTRMVTTLPESYILPRWRKDVKRKYTFIKSSYDDTEASMAVNRVNKLCTAFYEIAPVAGEFEETFGVLMARITEGRSKVLHSMPSSDNDPMSVTGKSPNSKNREHNYSL